MASLGDCEGWGHTIAYAFYGYGCTVAYNPATFDLDGDNIPDASDPYPGDPTNQLAKGGKEDNPNIAYNDETAATQGCENQPCPGIGMPGLIVNLSSLNFVLQDKDIAYTDIGRAIEIERSYNAFSTSQGIFGRGWTFNYGVYLVADASGNITVMHGSGAEKLFTLNTDGTYTPPKGVYDKLTKNTDGTFSLWVKDEKLTYTFEDKCPFVSYWELNEGSGTTAADSVSTNNGTIYGATWTSGVDGNALSFDGVDDYVNCGDIDRSEAANGTFEVWFKPALINSNHPIIAKSWTTSTIARWLVLRSNGSIQLELYDGAWHYVETGPGSVNAGNWYHVVASWGSDGMKIYLNGELKGTNTYTGSGYTSTYSLVIGKWEEQPGYAFNGAIDEVGIYDKALTVTEVQQHYQNGLAGHGYLGEGSGYTCHGLAGEIVLTSVTDTNNNTATMAYDGSGRLTTITDAAGRATTFTYNSDNQVATITDPLNRPITFTYENGNMKTSTDLAGVTTTFTYAANNFLQSMATPNGTTSFTYQDYAFGSRLVTVTNPANQTTQYTIDAPNQEVLVTDAKGNTTQYGYNYDGYTTYVTDSLGNKTAYGYDAAGNRVSITDANNKQTTIAYDTRGNITSITDPLTKTATFTYDTRDNLTQTKDPLNRQYTYTYDAHDNLTKITNPLTQQTNFAYNTKGELVSLTDARGKTATFAYDQQGNLLSITDPLNHTATFTYNLIGKQQTATDPLGNSSSFEYDPLGRLTKRIHPDATQFIIERYCSGISGIIDENGKHTTYDHNAINMLTRVHDPLGHQTNYAYDSAGNLTQLTDPLSQATAYTYDAADRLTQMAYPEGVQESYSYDPTGNLIAKTDAKGVTTTYAYDDVNRLVSLTAPDLTITGQRATFGFTYDAVGNLLTMADATGTTSYAYDSLNRLTNITYPTGLAVAYTYNEVGRITSIATPYGGVAYGYDNANRLSTITLPNAQQVIYQYDAAGNLLQVEYPNATAAAYAYDTRNRLTAMTNFAPANTVISTYAYTLDGVGNKTRTDLNEPMMPSYNAETINYTYTAGNILASADGNTYTHDANGNRVQKSTSAGTTTYTYDSLNRLVQVVKGTQTTQYFYNSLGQRVGRIDNGVQTNYLIDPNGILPQVLAETDASNNLIAFYVYDGASLVAKITPQNQYYFYHYDGLGSTIAITDNTGQVVNTYCYSPEGLVGTQETIPNPFTYVGRFGVMAEGNGLYFMRARYYDPEVGRFINKDLIGYAGGDLNLYGYTGNNLINEIDPSGLDVIISIQRLKSSGYSTPGFIYVRSTVKTDMTFSGATLEPNFALTPRIQTGNYSAWKRTKSDKGKVYKPARIQLNDVLGIEGAQIHVGNKPFPDSLGCILVGLTGDADTVEHSRAAMQAILDIIRADATGKIEVEINNYKMWFDPLYNREGGIKK